MKESENTFYTALIMGKGYVKQDTIVECRLISNLLNMRWILIFTCLFYFNGYSQLQDYTIGPKGDTLNGKDKAGKKQGKWVIRYDEVRGEPGYEEEGEFKDDKKEGTWRKYTLMSDLFAVENYRWGFKDGISQYFNMNGELIKEESWYAFDPEKVYDTIEVEDVNNPDHFNKVIIKNEGSSLKHGTWKYYDPAAGFITKTEFWRYGKMEDPDNPLGGSKKKETDNTTTVAKPKVKPKEVLDFEKKNAGKKKVKVRDGSVGY